MQNIFLETPLKKVLLSEPIDEAGISELRGKVEIVVSPDPSEESVGRLMREAHGLIVRTATKINRPMVEGANDLEVISRTGGGLDNVDVEAATDHGVVVCGVKGPQDRIVAEHTLALIMSLAKQLFYLDQEMRKGNFRARFEYRPVDLSGKRLGLIGLGRIGRLISGFALAFGMEVIAFDPFVPPDLKSGIFISQHMEDVIKTADFLSLHVPLTPETRGLIGKARLGMMKPTAFLINTSRGEVIDEQALVEALQRGTIAGAALDVFEKEPPAVKHPLFQMKNVILTPHSASLTKDNVAKLARGAARNVLAVFNLERPEFCANWDDVMKRKPSIPKRN